jgi:hypothetical protein
MKQPASKPTTHSQEVRQRRGATSVKPAASTTQPRVTAPGPGFSTPRARRVAAQASVPTRPVVVRNTSFGTPIHRQVATANPRRAYYVALSAPGTEMRLPSLPAIRPSWRMLSATIVILTVVGIFSLVFSPFFQVGPVSIKGLERLAGADVQAVLDLENLSILAVNPLAVQEQLIKRFPGLESATISVGLPNNVSVTLKERTPVLAWKQGDSIQWIDALGVIFPPNGTVEGLWTIHSPEAPLVVLPEAEGANSADGAAKTDGSGKVAKPKNPGPVRLDPAIFGSAQRLAERLPAGTALVYTSAQGLGWEDSTGYDVYIGTDLTNFDKKFGMVQAIAEQLIQDGIRPELINASNPDAPFYRAEQ